MENKPENPKESDEVISETVKKTKSVKRQKTDIENLPKVNRTIPCAYCETDKILNPHQYEKRIAYFGNHDAVLRHFKCQECETSENENPFSFNLRHSQIAFQLANELKSCFERFNVSGNALVIQSEVASILSKNGISAKNHSFVMKDNKAQSLKINFPFIGDVLISPLEFRKDKKVEVIS